VPWRTAKQLRLFQEPFPSSVGLMFCLIVAWATPLNSRSTMAARSFTAGSLKLLLLASRPKLFSFNFGKQLEFSDGRRSAASTGNGFQGGRRTFVSSGRLSRTPLEWRLRAAAVTTPGASRLVTLGA
jgi:hypothetical protein